jgi:hypothetical protein
MAVLGPYREDFVTAALIVLSVFTGLSMCIGTVAVAILLAHGKLTLPHTNMRRVQHARVAVEIAQARLDQERVQMMLDAQIDLRLQRAALPASTEGAQHGS